MEMLLLYVLVIALIILVPWVIDIFLSYRLANNNRDKFIEKAAEQGLTQDELNALLKSVAVPPPGIPGLSRATMALSVVMILGIAVFHLLVKGPADSSQTISNILSMFGGLLAAITGFYFGNKSKETNGTTSEPTAESKPLSTPVSISVTRAVGTDLPVGSSERFVAKGTFSDGLIDNITSKVSWASSDSTIATVSPIGLVTGVKVGSANITASLSGVISQSIPIKVV